MKTRLQFVVQALAVAWAMFTPALAATVTKSPIAPAIGVDDIANYGSVTGSDKWFYENSAAGAAKGQTFTTGNAAILLKSITYQTSTAAMATKTYAIRVGTVAGATPTFSQMVREAATQSAAWAAGDYVTWTFATPVLLQSNTTYGIDVGMIGSTSSWTTGIPYLSVTDNVYAGGALYNSGTLGAGTTAVGLSTVAGSVLTINPAANLAVGKAYAIRIDATAIDDLAGNSFAGITTDTTWNFTILADGSPPTLVGTAIVDDESGATVPVNTQVTYTVAFSEDMDANTVSAADFGNAGSAAVSIGTVVETSRGVFTVQATPTAAGSLQLQVNAGADLKDVANNALATTSAIADDTTIAVIADFAAWSGNTPFDADSNNDGVDNGIAWLLGAVDKDANALGKLPLASQTAGSLTLTFSCLNAATPHSRSSTAATSAKVIPGSPWRCRKPVARSMASTSPSRPTVRSTKLWPPSWSEKPKPEKFSPVSGHS